MMAERQYVKNDIRPRLRAFREKFPKLVLSAMRIEGEIETTEVKRRTPVSPLPAPKGVVPGTLRASVHLDGPIQEGGKYSMKIVAGGAAGAYAIPQHENLEYFHTTGQAKYIESVIFESRNYIAARVVKRIDIRMAKL